MFHALGYSIDRFDPADPGRLCRGRERWIEPLPNDDDAPAEPLHRVVLSGAAFSDDSAADALRGLPHSGVPVADAVTTLFPRRTLLAFMEDAHPADLPDDAEGVEAYQTYRAGGRGQELLVRWRKPVLAAKDVEALLAGDAPESRVLGFAVLQGDEDLDALEAALFLLTGFSTIDSPPARFQPSALRDVLKHCRALILLHRDKNGAALAVYANEPIKLDNKLEALAEKAGALLVSFAIPPMLARWDRALHEARAAWVKSGREDAFPVPRAEHPDPWARRRGRRGRRGDEELLIVDDPIIGERSDDDDDDDEE